MRISHKYKYREMPENYTEPQEQIVKKKRGRKPNPNKKNYYFCSEQEKAVVDYISTDDEAVKNDIFNKTLKPAFTIMIESIIRRYSLYPPTEEFQDTFDDTISFLMTKLSCFDPTTNYKAFSYCGTICKNYLKYKINQYAKNQKRNQSYDNPAVNLQGNISDNLRYSYTDSSQQESFLHELTGTTVLNIKNILKQQERYKLTNNEVKVGNALIDLMTNWDELFAQMGSDKFNKSSILLFLKETTNMTTKEIRDSMKVFKKEYYALKTKLIEE